ncbi:GNAT family N-acetyltransferase [uncultured Tessaracoccus sp.]|uniref:GNAT family N-acetyltransferase n=1 Tax=uncultured Tessaracoccus sp. TaxID=905023 RepID=UPI0025E3B08C|nr:GNAT family N-acetyltransferase [uncultured Tessaracoccus sp.]
MEIIAKRWDELTRDEFFEIARLRCEVFYVEQRVTVQDFDDVDRHPRTEHWFTTDDRGAATYLRVYALDTPEHGATAGFGRVAVRGDRRGEGLAKQLVGPVVERWGNQRMVLHSQDYITGLYEPFEFRSVGEPYEEAGIAHRIMVREPGPLVAPSRFA